MKEVRAGDRADGSGKNFFPLLSARLPALLSFSTLKMKKTEGNGNAKADVNSDMVGRAHPLGLGMGGSGLDVGTMDAQISAAGYLVSGEATVKVSYD